MEMALVGDLSRVVSALLAGSRNIVGNGGKLAHSTLCVISPNCVPGSEVTEAGSGRLPAVTGNIAAISLHSLFLTTTVSN